MTLFIGFDLRAPRNMAPIWFRASLYRDKAMVTRETNKKDMTMVTKVWPWLEILRASIPSHSLKYVNRSMIPTLKQQ